MRPFRVLQKLGFLEWLEHMKYFHELLGFLKLGILECIQLSGDLCWPMIDLETFLPNKFSAIYF